jgi:hypothetical protein
MPAQRYVLFLFFCLTLGLPAAHSQPICDHPHCNSVARISEITAEPITGIRLEIAGFTVTVPAPERIVADGETLFLHLGGDEVIAIGPERLPEELRTTRATIPGNRIPEIIFLQSADEASYRTEVDEQIWRFALSLKRYHFSNATRALAVQRGDLRYYLSDSDLVGFSGQALIVKPELKNHFMRMDALNMDFERFKAIVMSVH